MSRPPGACPGPPGLPHGRQSHVGHQSSFGADLGQGATVLGGLYEQPAALESRLLGTLNHLCDSSDCVFLSPASRRGQMAESCDLQKQPRALSSTGSSSRKVPPHPQQMVLVLIDSGQITSEPRWFLSAFSRSLYGWSA